MAKLSLESLWIDYVPSESNPADVPSRAHGIHDAASALADFGAFTPMVIPSFATDGGDWLSYVEIAESVW